MWCVEWVMIHNDSRILLSVCDVVSLVTQTSTNRDWLRMLCYNALCVVYRLLLIYRSTLITKVNNVKIRIDFNWGDKKASLAIGESQLKLPKYTTYWPHRRRTTTTHCWSTHKINELVLCIAKYARFLTNQLFVVFLKHIPRQRRL